MTGLGCSCPTFVKKGPPQKVRGCTHELAAPFQVTVFLWFSWFTSITFNVCNVQAVCFCHSSCHALCKCECLHQELDAEPKTPCRQWSNRIHHFLVKTSGKPGGVQGFAGQQSPCPLGSIDKCHIQCSVSSGLLLVQCGKRM